MNKKNLHKGFSLLETVLYLGIFAIIGGSLFGILTNVTRVSTREISGSEVSNQLQFAMETVSRLVRESSNIESATIIATTTLKLRMADPLLDPTCVFLDNGVLRLSQGPDASLPQNCTSASTALTTDKVIVDSALFKRVEFPGGHDLVAVDFQFSNTASGASKISRALHSGISRASAATFDSDLLPNVDNSYEVGFSGVKRWKNISISNLLNLGVIAGDPTGIDGSIYYNSTDKTFRGKANGTWSNLGSSLWIATSTNAMYAGVSGNVGIGTMSPAAILHAATSDGTGVAFLMTGKPGDGTAADYTNGAAFVLSHNGEGNRQFTIGDSSSGNGVRVLGNYLDGYNFKTNIKMDLNLANSTNKVLFAGGAWQSNGNVGIGTVTPSTKLSIKQALDNTQQGISVMNAAGSTGLYMWSGGDVAHIDGCDDANCKIAINGSGTGNVGIGTANPKTALDVNGSIKFGTSNICTADTEGSIRYNSSKGAFEGCDGAQWVVIYQGSSQEAINYNSSTKTHKDCVAAGGKIIEISGDASGTQVCQFTASAQENAACPSGWNQAKNWSTTEGCSSGDHNYTTAVKWVYCNVPDGYVSDWCPNNRCSDPSTHPYSLAGHSWSNAARLSYSAVPTSNPSGENGNSRVIWNGSSYTKTIDGCGKRYANDAFTPSVTREAYYLNGANDPVYPTNYTDIPCGYYRPTISGDTTIGGVIAQFHVKERMAQIGCY